MAENLTFRYAERKDTQLILLFILELARYEKLEQEVVATPEKKFLKNWQPSQWRGDAAVWNGGVWTGTSRVLIFICRWGQNP